jgi:hypothetical protein
MVYALYRHIDYSICTLEFETRRESYYWVLEALDLYRPKVRHVLLVLIPLWIRVKFQQSRADSTCYCYKNISRLLFSSQILIEIHCCSFQMLLCGMLLVIDPHTGKVKTQECRRAQRRNQKYLLLFLCTHKQPFDYNDPQTKKETLSTNNHTHTRFAYREQANTYTERSSLLRPRHIKSTHSYIDFPHHIPKRLLTRTLLHS